MNLKYLNDQELGQSLVQAVRVERESLSDVLHHIVEVERRKLYLKRGYPSLFKYLTEYLKYANGTAQRRIDAARLMKDFPSLPEKLESGELNLGQVSLMQKALRQKRKESQQKNTSLSKLESQQRLKFHQNQESLEENASHLRQQSSEGNAFHLQQVSRAEKQEILESLIGKSERESQQMLAQALDLKLQVRAHAQIQKDESVRLEVTFGKEQWAKLERMRELLSTSIPDGSWQEVLTYVAEKVIQQKTKVPASRVSAIKTSTRKESTTNALASRTSEIKAPTRSTSETKTVKAMPSTVHLKHSTKKAVLNRDTCCQYQDTKTGKQCSSRWNLQIDHIHPRWDSGSHEPENLQVLCAAHNRQRYREQAGIH